MYLLIFFADQVEFFGTEKIFEISRESRFISE
jgi:hypothetical protein